MTFIHWTVFSCGVLAFLLGLTDWQVDASGTWPLMTAIWCYLHATK